MASSVAAPAGAAVGRSRSKFTRIAVFGFALIASGMALWLAGSALAGQDLGQEGVFFVGAIALSLIGAAVVWQLGTAGKAVGIVLALAIFAPLFWVAFSVFFPVAFVEFSGAVMFVLGFFSALIGCIAGIVRRNVVAPEATRGEARAMRIMVAVVALAMVVSGLLNVVSRNTVDAAAAAGATPVAMDSFAFNPATIEVPAGEPTTLLVRNGDAFAHDFAIAALGVDPVVIGPGSEELIEVPAPAAGEYEVLCNLHPDMAATLTAR